MDLEPIATSSPQEQPAPSPTRPWPRWTKNVLLGAVVALLAGSVAVLLTRDEDPSPARLVADARASTNEQRTMSFTGRLRVESKDPDGGSFIQRAEIDGRVRLPEDARYRIVSDGFVSEVITLGDRLYTREAEGPADLRGKKWAAFDPNVDDDRSGVVRPSGPTESADIAGDPIGLLRTLDAARRPVLLRSDENGAVVKATVDATAAYGSAVVGEVDRATVELTLDGDRLDRLVLDASGEGGSLHADYRFTGWGRQVEVAAPATADLDPTPGIEEEEIAAFKDAPLLQPRGIPAGWVLDFAGVLPEEMTAEGCEQVELDYIEPDDPDKGYLTLYELPKSCADLEPPRGAEAFQAGRYSGFVDESRDGVLAQIVVGDTVVQAETDLPLDALARILADLVPLNLAAPPAPLPGFTPTTPA
ncbi:MAG: hypothetical protein QOG87_333 [Actinomycetota bacterium]|jgi:hypothetical protein